MTTGMGGAAMVGVGLLLAAAPDAPAPSAPAVQLASFDSLLASPPLSPTTEWWWWYEGGRGSVRADSNPAENTFAAALGGAAGFNIFNPIGRGGWLIGDGIDAAADCVGAACNGGNAGLLFGNGGDGANGGRGGAGGFFFGAGGKGGDGVPGANGTLADRDGQKGGAGGPGGA
ncbi:hypothetical protein ACQI4D_02330, partial [Mycolicibacterium pulveris]